jgi:hypothetical protein
MSDNPQLGSEPEKLAQILNDFKKHTTDELAVIHSRLTWMLMPAFFILLVVLGLSVFTWINVNEIQNQLKITNQSIEDLRKNVKSRAPSTAPEVKNGDKVD